jgi:signal transduction histidine kinase
MGEEQERSQQPERAPSLLRAILDSIADGVLVVTETGRVAACNQPFLALWRVPAELAERRDDQALLEFASQQLVDPRPFLRTMREVYGAPERETCDVLRFRDGRVFERSSRPQRMGAAVIGRVWSFHDVTEREHLLQRTAFLSRANQRLLDRAREALCARDELLSIAAHEIRGPITTIHLAVQSLLERPGEACVPRLLDAVQRADRRLTRMVDELLDVARIQGGNLQLHLEPMCLGELVREVAARFVGEAALAGSPISVATEGDLAGNWDRLRLDQVITNLLSNAIKFGAGKPVEIRAQSQGGTARLVVRDQGIGIPRDQIERIFDPFERAVPGRNHGGLRHGRDNVRPIASRHGGAIQVESELGGGSTFTVLLPQVRAPQ